MKNELSTEVRLLFDMLMVDTYYGFPDASDLVGTHDYFREKNAKGNIPNILAKTFCYEQIIEYFVRSLYEQDKLWRRVRNISNLRESDKYDRIIKMMSEFIDFDNSLVMQKLCDEFRLNRNQLAHELLKKSLREWAFIYNNVDEKYSEILRIYMEQETRFVNRINQELQYPEKFLIKGKDYLRDIEILEKLSGVEEQNEHFVNYTQLINLLKDFMDRKECKPLIMCFYHILLEQF